MIDYDARALLIAFLESKQALTQAEAAKQLDIPPSALSAYLKGTQRPRDETRERIAKWSRGKIPVASWRTAEEQAAITGQSVAFIPKAASDNKKTRKPAA